MGQEIVYCFRCQSQLRGADFDKGRAVRAGVHSYCKPCVPQELIAGADTVTDDPPVAETPKPRPALKESTPRSGTHARVEAAKSTRRSNLARRPTAWALGAGVGIAVVVVLAALAASGGGKPRPKTGAAPSGTEEVPPPVATPADPPRPEVRPPRETPPRETPRKPKEDFQTDLARLDPEVQSARQKEALQAAVGLLEGARKRHADPEWEMWVDKRLRDLNIEVEKLFASAKEEAVQAKRRGDEERVKQVRERVARWGIEGRNGDLAAALAAVVVDRPATVPKPVEPPPPPPDVDAYRKRWETAAAAAAARDYSGAVRELEQAAASLRDEKVRAEAAADLEAFRQAEALHGDAFRALAAWPKGEKLVLSILDEAAAPQRVEIKGEGNALPSLPWGEVLAGSLVEALAARRPPLGGVGPAVFCLLDGDPEGAAKAQRPGAPPVPEKYWTQARKPAAPDAKEQKARAEFYATEAAHADPASAAESVLKFRALLSEFGDTRFVRRNREFIASRTNGAREFLFFAAEWISSGSFRPARHNKLDFCWISDRDEAPERQKENFVEITFSALPDTEYRCWVYVGGCCLEVFGFSTSGTDFPGGEAPVPAKLPPFFGVPKNHASHAGPKEPDRWTWVQIPLPKYATAGPKQLRVHTNQKGFSTAYAFVSALKGSPPRDADLADAERARAELLGDAAADPGLIGLWRFEEGKGASAADASKSKNHAALKNGPVWGAGKVGGGLSFDGVDDCLETPDSRFRTVVDTFTMAFWASPTATRPTTKESTTGAAGLAKQRYVIFPSHGEGSGTAGTGVSVGTNGISVFEHATAHLPSLLVHDAPVAGWVHVAVVFDRRLPKLYVNGALVKTGVMSAKSVYPSPARVGNPYGFYQGAVDEIRVYNRALAAAEVAALAGLAAPPPAEAAAPKLRSPKEGLQVLYRFEEGKGATVRDLSGIGAPLDVHIAEEGAVRWIKKRGLLVHQSTLIESAGPATKVIEACKATHEVTIEAWVRPGNVTQTGPARIVSLSVDTSQRNFTLGQAGAGYEVRLRTSATNANGIPPATTAAGAEPRLSHLLYSRTAAGATRLYINGVEAGAGSVAGDFSTWTAGFRLLLANEPTRERTWLGEYHQVAVYSRAFTAAEAAQKFKAGLE